MDPKDNDKDNSEKNVKKETIKKDFSTEYIKIGDKLISDYSKVDNLRRRQAIYEIPIESDIYEKIKEIPTLTIPEKTKSVSPIIYKKLDDKLEEEMFLKDFEEEMFLKDFEDDNQSVKSYKTDLTNKTECSKENSESDEDEVYLNNLFRMNFQKEEIKEKVEEEIKEKKKKMLEDLTEKFKKIKKPLPPVPKMKTNLDAIRQASKLLSVPEINLNTNIYQNAFSQTSLKSKPVMKKHKCPTEECNFTSFSEADLNIHYMEAHVYNAEENWNEDVLSPPPEEDEVAVYSNHTDEEFIEEYPPNPNGQFECPVCSNRYANVHHLNNHFINSHSSYSDMTMLKKSNKESFPGLNLLRMIGMIELLELKRYTRDYCPICALKFRKKIDICMKISDQKNTYVDGYESDDSLYISSLNFHNFSDGNIKTVTRSSVRRRSPRKQKAYPELDNFIKIANMNLEPVRLTCCNNIICRECLKKSTEYNGVLCPICKCNHEKPELDYLRVIEETSYCDKSKWRGWWEKHIEILF